MLLDALTALEAHLSSIILVGAQAVYLHAGEADLAVAPYTTDADLAIDVDALAAEPLLESAMVAAGFQPGEHPGMWFGAGRVQVDLMVAEAQGGGGSRAARIPPHARHVARKALGLEAAIVDRDRRSIAALAGSDARRFEVFVAGPAALLIAKLIKIDERQANPRRQNAKDALDVLRLLRVVEPTEIATRVARIEADVRAHAVSRRAMEILPALFGSPDGSGCQMAVQATEGLEDPDEIAGSCAALAADLVAAVQRLRPT